MVNVFISYARRDGIEYCDRLYNDLRKRSINIWRDTREMDPYKGFDAEIETALEKSTHVVVILTEAVKNPRSFVRLEIAYATARGKQVIPLLFPSGHIPITIVTLTFIDFSTWDKGLSALIERLFGGEQRPIFDPERHIELLYIENLGRRLDHWRKLYVTLDARRTGGPRKAVELKDVTAALYLDSQLLVYPLDRHAVKHGAKPEEITTIEELLSVVQKLRRVALIGASGAGKTTTLERLAVELASNASQDRTAPLPLIAPLREYEGGDFDKFLASLSANLEWPKVFPDRIVLLLDGFNEIPVAHQESVVDWLTAHQSACVILTSRRIDDISAALKFHRVDLQPLSVSKIYQFIGNYLADSARNQFFWSLAGEECSTVWKWYQGSRNNPSFEEFWYGTTDNAYVLQPEFRLRKIQLDLQNYDLLPGLLSMVRRPLLLFLAIQTYVYAGKLPTSNRAELFERFVTLLLHGPNNRSLDQQSEIAKFVRPALSQLAFMIIHTGKGTGVERNWACSIIESIGGSNSGESILGIATECGLLQTGSQVSFSHHLFQEYLAAEELHVRSLQSSDFSSYFSREDWWKETGWEESFLFLAEIMKDASRLIAAITPLQPTLAFRCTEQSEVECSADVLHSLYQPKLAQRVSPEARAHWGRLVAQLGDTRTGVGIGNHGLPDISWCEIPVGISTMGGDPLVIWGAYPRMEVLIPYSFRISKYPITFAQYEPFVSDGGYEKDEYWTKSGLEWRGHIKHPSQFWNDPYWHIPNHPIIGVSWYEAFAYCRWLSEKLGPGIGEPGYMVRLPTDSEWEKASRYPDDRKYPWGEQYIVTFANIDETENGDSPFFLNRTVAVGLYEHAANPYTLVCDLAGNVWEWTHSKLVQPFQFPEDNDPEGNNLRVVRGGSFQHGSNVARSAYRGWPNSEGCQDWDQGFRVCWGPALYE